MHGWTEHAVAAILTGQAPEEGRLPILADHPQNLFVLLGSSYRIRAYETHTRLCPRTYCRQQDGDDAAPVEGLPEPEGGGAIDSFASDVSILYLHFVLPDSLT